MSERPGGEARHRRPRASRRPGTKEAVQVSSIIDNSQPAIRSKIIEYKVRKHWTEVVGEGIAARAQPARLVGRTLYCTVSSGPWMTELNYQKGTIIEGINKRLSTRAVKEIIFRHGQVRLPPGKEERRPSPPRRLTQEERRFIDETVRGVEDAALRTAIKRAIERSKS